MSEESPTRVGVVEGFFGPEWRWEDRRHFCEALPSLGGEFYIYAPKRDPYLRKNWTENHPPEWWAKLNNLGHACSSAGAKFGVALSPFELHDHWSGKMKSVLRAKVTRLNELGIGYLGLFFDDMRGAPDLAAKQAEIVDLARECSPARIIFCPTYYSEDPILDKVFGARPEGYLERIGRELHPDVAICWTGKKVISPVIEGGELTEVAAVLRRKPFVWDNFFANDGPKMCKFLKINPFHGRSKGALEQSSGWALNLMNQPALSEALFLASAAVLKGNLSPEAALDAALESRTGRQMAALIQEHLAVFNEIGLDKLDKTIGEKIALALDMDTRSGREIKAWLDGFYIVGSECLTD